MPAEMQRLEGSLLQIACCLQGPAAMLAWGSLPLLPISLPLGPAMIRVYMHMQQMWPNKRQALLADQSAQLICRLC